MQEIVWERGDCVSADLEQSVVLLDLDSLLYHSLNETAAEVWHLLAEPRTAAELTDRMCEKFEVAPEQCRASVDRLLDRMQSAGLVKASV